MAYDIGPRIGIDGEAEFRKAINNINTNIRTLGTEMLAVTSAYDANDKSAAALTARNEVLVKQIDAQKEGLAASAEKYGDNDEKTQRWQQTVNKATADLNKLERQLAENKRTIQDVEESTSDASEETAEFGEAADRAAGGAERRTRHGGPGEPDFLRHPGSPERPEGSGQRSVEPGRKHQRVPGGPGEAEHRL